MWRVARSLEVLREEINAAAPRRSTVSDGSIGDAAHATRSSDHNPWVIVGGQGIVRARDFTHDPAGGLDCNELAAGLASMIALGGHPALRSGAYVIWQRRIFSFDRRHEGWRPYSGSNPHDHHCHLSVTTDPAGFDSAQPWFVMTPKEDEMAEYADQLDRIEKKLADIAESEAARDKAERERMRGRHQRIIARLDKLAQDVADDASRAQVRRLRDDLAAEEPVEAEPLP